MNSLRLLGLVGLTVVGVALGAVAAQMASAQTTVETYKVPFGTELVTFCSDGGPIDHGEAEFALGEFGFESASDAITAFEAETREAATNPEIPEQLRELLSPSVNTTFAPSGRAAPEGLAFFDVESSGAAELEARIVVIDTGPDGWKIAETFRCMSTVVDDLERFDQLAEEVYGR